MTTYTSVDDLPENSEVICVYSNTNCYTVDKIYKTGDREGRDLLVHHCNSGEECRLRYKSVDARFTCVGGPW